MMTYTHIHDDRSLYETQIRGQTCRFTRTHYPDYEQTTHCSYSLMLVLSREAANNCIAFGFSRPLANDLPLSQPTS